MFAFGSSVGSFASDSSVDGVATTGSDAGDGASALVGKGSGVTFGAAIGRGPELASGFPAGLLAAIAAAAGAVAGSAARAIPPDVMKRIERVIANNDRVAREYMRENITGVTPRGGAAYAACARMEQLCSPT